MSAVGDYLFGEAPSEWDGACSGPIRGLVSLADQGWWPGGMAPYGYDLGYFDQTGALFQIVRNTDDGQKLILDPAGNPVRTVSRGPSR